MRDVPVYDWLFDSELTGMRSCNKRETGQNLRKTVRAVFLPEEEMKHPTSNEKKFLDKKQIAIVDEQINTDLCIVELVKTGYQI